MKLALDRMPTPIGDLLIVFDEDERLRALDWEDYEARMRRLLRLQYRAELALHSGSAPSQICDAIASYFAGDHARLDKIEV
jgi:methylated-DNA-[protein]-cysteine S-methyltransferase